MSFGMWRCPGEQDPTKPFFGAYEIRLKRRCTPMVSDQTMESIMLDIIISLSYRQSCKASLSVISEGPLGLMARWASRGFKEPNWPS
jgi:hypothetical protein